MKAEHILRHAVLELADDHTVELLAVKQGWCVTVASPSRGGPQYDACDGGDVESALLDALRMILELRSDGLIPADQGGGA